MIASERSFRIQLSAIALIALALFFVPFSISSRWIMFVSTWLILFAEALNSAIERVVDLITEEYHPLAGEAKDIGAFSVFLAFCITAAVWIWVIFHELLG